MSKALSLDLRTRVLAAISGGLSCREGTVKASQYRSISASDPAERGGDSGAKTVKAHWVLVRIQVV